MALSREATRYDEDRLRTLLVQARRLYLDGKYQEAEDLSKIILDEWPKNEDARLIMSKSIRRNAKKIQKQKSFFLFGH